MYLFNEETNHSPQTAQGAEQQSSVGVMQLWVRRKQGDAGRHVRMEMRRTVHGCRNDTAKDLGDHGSGANTPRAGSRIPCEWGSPVPLAPASILFARGCIQAQLGVTAYRCRDGVRRRYYKDPTTLLRPTPPLPRAQPEQDLFEARQIRSGGVALRVLELKDIADALPGRPVRQRIGRVLVLLDVALLLRDALLGELINHAFSLSDEEHSHADAETIEGARARSREHGSTLNVQCSTFNKELLTERLAVIKSGKSPQSKEFLQQAIGERDYSGNVKRQQGGDSGCRRHECVRMLRPTCEIDAVTWRFAAHRCTMAGIVKGDNGQ
ncbi:uncharacterized protein BXZ73DRAFT_79368 [Epithele typhae]|uniref:uncharacterized protein n=1 Tax=Epithele typhae TaxID=378194 RepID=UPI002007FE0E|nr:uncharacterized protein BXZ73DRAFT_79368 [Epithele typhae]KAH9923970.1 hypothetical protein BXZ73DRAFT_79368 [Epithele typhae]